MSYPLHSKICLTEAGCVCPAITLFLVPEPLMPGGSVLHLLEQAVVTDPDAPPQPDVALVASVETPAEPERPEPAVRPELRAFAAALPDPDRVRAILRDHLILDPYGLDLGDRAELTRLALLPERRIGFRRTEDFQADSMRRAMLAVYRHFGLDQRVPLVYHGYADPAAGWFGLRTAAA
ncbi:hypothetical protein IU433_25925 [Nocardia puris]|uniref:Uncharacterized protein n=1 Tax=Nocardia puris TaxID=208602 RepID=A0A366E4J7_9NOCA|nr:hypothetical protein [Nocardia puris]MBF6214652.1 hypothetical protein [Nocardia puris]MBF6368874.1 hypothetical protein [Nocardia puris]MBF6462454.1 hypothetical protein [Nocardia puris]RBO97035.1 hypothetical protein DFR74_1011054 [Nocardia puris]